MRETRRSLSSGFVRPLPADALWQANLGYRAVLGLEILTRVLAYGGWVVIILVRIAWRGWRLPRCASRRVRAPYPWHVLLYEIGARTCSLVCSLEGKE